MKFLNVTAWTIAIIGAVNWGLIGAFNGTCRYAIWRRQLA